MSANLGLKIFAYPSDYRVEIESDIVRSKPDRLVVLSRSRFDVFTIFIGIDRVRSARLLFNRILANPSSLRFTDVTIR